MSSEQDKLIERARRVLPAGGFGNLTLDNDARSENFIIRNGKGGRVWDFDGNQYIDYLLGSGPMLIGHAHPEVIEAVQDQITKGTTFFANSAPGILLAEEIVRSVPCAEKVRFTSSGSEATLFAMRAARAHRRREKILKFEGAYHGMNDYALVSTEPSRLANFPEGVPDSAGIPGSVYANVLVAPFNDADAAKALIDRHHNELGGVIVEPFQRLLRPKPGFLQALRDATARYRIPLIFDEVVSGFRLRYGGAQEHYGVVPDLCTLGKVIGGGFPLAAVAGREPLMAHFSRKTTDERDFLPQIGTLNGNPVAAAAGLATLEILRRPGTYERLFENGRTLMTELERLLEASGLTAQVVGECPVFDIVFTDELVRDYRAVFRADHAASRRFNRLLLERGILKADSRFYVSVAHTEEDLEVTLKACAGAIEELAASTVAAS